MPNETPWFARILVAQTEWFAIVDVEFLRARVCLIFPAAFDAVVWFTPYPARSDV